ncbi:MAG TPA: hypothetical protein VMW48_16640, partial [Vicinamibacterales bacterium]|nr:hypothetical protein [Vicinamibacterales bacterium]
MRIPMTTCVALLTAAALVQSGAAQGPAEAVTYRFHYAAAGDASAAITLEWATPLPESRALVMPRAIPMGYGEQRYDAFVSDVAAT